MKMKYILILIISFAFGQSVIYLEDNQTVSTNPLTGEQTIITLSIENSAEYERGFTNALESLALLALELDFKNERKTYGEMFDILYERHQIRSKQ